MIAEISHYLSILATALFFLTAIFSLLIKNNKYISKLSRSTFNHAFIFLACSFAIYIFMAINDEFSVRYIYSHSNSKLPVFYKISSIWSAHEGSMFLWILFLGLWGFIFNIKVAHNQPLKSKSIGILSIILVGFLLFLLITSNPFLTFLPVPPNDGADINPVLQDPALALHPPILYLGYVGFVIPFACSISYLLHGDPNLNWELLVRKWSVMAWIFLTLGIALGSWWAYYELGWGGYWFWDPVENVALMPWLAATAFIHSLTVSIKSSSLRVWTILLALSVFSFSLFGAFIVRSGIIDSVHSFANDPDRGLYLLAFIGLIIFSSLLLFVVRLPIAKSRGQIKKFSKESFISVNNIFFITLVFSILLGVTYPLIYEYIYDQKISVGAPFYNAIFVPIVILASLFLFFSIDSKWSRNLKLNLLKVEIYLPIFLSIILVLVCKYLFAISNLMILFSLIVAGMIIFRYLYEIKEYLVRKKYLNFYSAIAHLALGVLILSISFNNVLSSERALTIKISESVEYKNLQINFNDLKLQKRSNHDAIKASFIVEEKNCYKFLFICNNKFFELLPEKRKYFARGQITTETAIRATLLKDIYLTIGDQLDDGSWIVNIQINYLIRWIWFSAVLMALAGIMLIISKRKV